MTLRTHQKIPEYERFSYADASSPNEAGENNSKRKSDIADQNPRMPLNTPRNALAEFIGLDLQK
jgi:hypothetical protein